MTALMAFFIKAQISTMEALQYFVPTIATIMIGEGKHGRASSGAQVSLSGKIHPTRDLNIASQIMVRIVRFLNERPARELQKR